jgi:hypothetical protein
MNKRIRKKKIRARMPTKLCKPFSIYLKAYESLEKEHRKIRKSYRKIKYRRDEIWYANF